MADRPVIFSGSMVRALLAGTKTQTRRILKPEPRLDHFASEHLEDFELRGFEVVEQPDGRHLVYRPTWQAGDRLWVRETWAVGNIYDGVPPSRINPTGKPGWCGIRYAATDERLGIHDRASIHMPRWASRLTLDVTQVRVQRLQDISEEDARAEGMACLSKDGGRTWKHGIADRDGLPGTDNDGWPWSEWSVDPRRAYATLWNRLHGPDAWAANPFVAAISFSVTPANIDSLPEQP